MDCRQLEVRTMAIDMLTGCKDFNHPGPLLIHLSRVPDGQDIRSYDGSGEWVKIQSRGLLDATVRPLNWELYTDVPPHVRTCILFQMGRHQALSLSPSPSPSPLFRNWKDYAGADASHSLHSGFGNKHRRAST